MTHPSHNSITGTLAMSPKNSGSIMNTQGTFNNKKMKGSQAYEDLRFKIQ
jgi:hypothetical protein